MYRKNVLFSSNKFNICRVKESSSSSTMERFLNTYKQNHESTIFANGKITCFWGRPGSGKTTRLKQEFEHSIIIDPEILKSKQTTLDFFERLGKTHIPVIFEDWEAIQDLIGIREITQSISPYSPTIIVSHRPVKLTNNTVCIEWSGEDLRRRTLSGTMDIFETPKEYVHRLMRGNWDDVSPGDIVHEHGHVWSIVQENYPDRIKGDIDKMAYIANLMSEADVIDTDFYDQNDWSIVLAVFTLVSCISPCRLMNSIKSEPRTGSLWTKYQNICKREKNIQSLLKRSRGTEYPLTIDAIQMAFRMYFLNEDFSLCKEYRLQPCDIDVLNHIIGPFKPKFITLAKKSI
jgi:hypothetical protein